MELYLEFKGAGSGIYLESKKLSLKTMEWYRESKRVGSRMKELGYRITKACSRIQVVVFRIQESGVWNLREWYLETKRMACRTKELGSKIKKAGSRIYDSSLQNPQKWSLESKGEASRIQGSGILDNGIKI